MKPLFFFLVDDDADDTSLFQEILMETEADAQFMSAIDGQEALELLRRPQASLPDIIFLDLNMPRLGGKECLREMKKDERLHGIPVIIYTTSSQSKDIEEAIMTGAVGFITKPSSIRDLKQIVEAIVSHPLSQLPKTLQALSNHTNTFIVC